MSGPAAGPSAGSGTVRRPEEARRERFTDEERALAARVAAAIVQRRMALPATLFLESVRPMNFLAGQAVHFLDPMLSVVLDFRQIEAFGLLREKRSAVDLLLGEIEGREAARKAT